MKTQPSQKERKRKNRKTTEFPGSPVVRTLHFHCRGTGWIPGWGTEILHVAWPGKKRTGKQQNNEELGLETRPPDARGLLPWQGAGQDTVMVTPQAPVHTCN